MTPEETRVYGRALGSIARFLAATSEEERRDLAEVPIRRAIEVLDDYEAWADFDHVSPELEAVDGHVRMLGGAGWARCYWQLVLLHLIARGLQAGAPFVLPPSIRGDLLVELNRIVDEVDEVEPRWSLEDPLGDYALLLDLAFARGDALTMDCCIAVPVWVPEPAGDFTAGLWIQLHYRDLESIGFSPRIINWSTPYLLDFLEANPDCQGFFGVSWLADPRLADVAPHLSWYREVVIAAGARMSPAGTDDRTIAQATNTSDTRRGLFEKGEYQPQDYRLVFTREDTLAWYERTAHLLPPPKRPDPRAAAAYAALESETVTPPGDTA